MTLAALTVMLSVTLAKPAAVPEVVTLREHKGWVGAVAFGSDQFFNTLSADKTVGSWLAPSGRAVLSLQFQGDILTDMVFNPTGKGSAVCGFDGTIRLLGGSNATFGKPGVLTGHKGAVLTLSFAPVGRLLASGGVDGTVRLWKSGQPTVVLRGHRSWVNCVRFSADGKRLASASSDATVRLWRQENGKWKTESIKEVPEGEVRCVAFSPDGKLVALGTRYGTVRIWDLAQNKEPAVLKGHPGDVWALAFSPDGKTLASGGGDWDRPGEIRLYDTASWKRRATLRHTGEVLCVAYSPNGRLLAAGGWNGVVKLWDVSRLAAVKKSQLP
jgi:WD40 repeat protein